MTFAGTWKITEAGIRGMLLAQLTGIDPEWYAPLTFVDDDPTLDPYTNTAGWMGGVPGMTEKKGEHKFSPLRTNFVTIAQKDWECNIPIPRKDWLKNRGQVIQKRIDDQVQVVRSHPGTLIQQALESGAATACYDGQYYFDTDHSEGSSGTQDNDLTSSAVAPATPTTAEMKTAIMKGVAAILGFKNDKGEEVNLGANDFIVGAPMTHYTKVLETLGVITETGGNTDIIKAVNPVFKLTPQPMPKLTGNKIIVARRRSPRMGSAMIMQVALPVEPIILGIESEHCKLHDEVLVMAKGTYNVGYGDWKDACLVTFS